jgi:hypothetical protein
MIDSASRPIIRPRPPMLAESEAVATLIERLGTPRLPEQARCHEEALRRRAHVGRVETTSQE